MESVVFLLVSGHGDFTVHAILNGSTGRLNMLRKALVNNVRLILCLAVVQTIGGVVGTLLTPFDNALFCFWVGAVVATPIGLGLGIFLQFRHTKASLWQDADWLFWYICACAVMLFVGGVTFVVPLYMSQVDHVERLARLDASEVIGLSVRAGDFDGPVVWQTEDSDRINEFTKACRDIRFLDSVDRNVRKRGQSVKELTIEVRLEDGERIVAECFINVDYEGIYGRLVFRDGNRLRSHGSFFSITLRAWFDEAIPVFVTSPSEAGV